GEDRCDRAGILGRLELVGQQGGNRFRIGAVLGDQEVARVMPRRRGHEAGPPVGGQRCRVPAQPAHATALRWWARASLTSCSNRPRCSGSSIFSGCHCTPTQAHPVLGSTASITPPVAVAVISSSPGSAI